MGFVLRTVIAVGVVYAMSPLRDEQPAAELAARARSAVAAHASQAVGAATELCLKDHETCGLMGLPQREGAAASRPPWPSSRGGSAR